MKELFREPDASLVGYLQSVLENEGIPTMIKNEHLNGSGLTEVPIPEFFPALNVIHDTDYQRAMEILREFAARSRENAGKADEDRVCRACGEANPGNFEICWSCGESLITEEVER